MHELSLAESVIRIIESAALTQQFSSVRTIFLEVGRLAGVEPEALQFCFGAAARDTVAQDARLEIIEVPGEGTCADCGSVHPVHSLLDACPACGAYAVQVSGGNGMRVRELDVV
jgi:hydrogenase nickel incorporation protein HypA/HybF